MDKEWEVTFSAWADGPGKTEQEKCERAERAVKNAIDNHRVLQALDLTVRAHGSYRVRTSIKQESDVDIYVQVNKSDFFPRYPEGKTKVDFGNVDGTFDYAAFKNEVGLALRSYIGAATVTNGKNAFDVHENTYRIDADVIAVLPCRWYTGRFNVDYSHHYYEGIAFRNAAGAVIKSFPEDAYTSGAAKNDATFGRYKRVIRVIKNLRSYMEEKGVAEAKGIASFLIECLVWNVPDDMLGDDAYWQDVYRILDFLRKGTASWETCQKWKEVNEIRDLWDAKQLWTFAQANSFASAAWKFLEFN